jgi:hypothetical protein
MSEKKGIILPKSKKVIAKVSSKRIDLPVKNFELYFIKILSLDIKPVKVKISGKKSWKYKIPIELVEIIPTNQEKIEMLKSTNPRDNKNYMNIEQFGKNKLCIWKCAPTHYDILSAFLLKNNIGLDEIFAFERTGIGFDTRLIFMTEKQAKNYLDTIRKQIEKKDKETKSKK